MRRYSFRRAPHKLLGLARHRPPPIMHGKRGIRWRARAAIHALSVSALLLLAARLLLMPDPLNQLRESHSMLLDGQIQQAFQHYQQLYAAGQQRPELLLQLAQVRLLRGEALEAEPLLIRSLGSAPAPQDMWQAQLAYGWAVALQGRYQHALDVWQRLPAQVQGRAALLRSEAALRRGDPEAALQAIRRIRPGRLPIAWRGLARYRLALLLADSAPQAALETLAEPVTTESAAGATWVLPPLGAWQASVWEQRADTLRQALQKQPTERKLALAGLLAEEGHLSAARTLLRAAEPTQRGSQEALVFDIQLSRQLGDDHGALDKLQTALAQRPDSAPLLRLLALLQLEQNPARASKTLTRVQQLEPIDPDNLVVEAAIKRAEHNYPAAAQAYSQAIERAEPERQPHYHFHAARFYYTTTWRQCDAGVRHARAAADEQAQAEPWAVLGELLLRCGRYEDALDAGSTMVERWADEPAGHFIRGVALKHLRRSEAARLALLRAANLAPAGVWRAQVEEILAR